MSSISIIIIIIARIKHCVEYSFSLYASSQTWQRMLLCIFLGPVHIVDKIESDTIDSKSSLLLFVCVL